MAITAKRGLVVAAALVCAGLTGLNLEASAKPFGFWKEMNEQKEAALRCEAEGKWKKIHWRSTMDEVLIDASRTNKPILVVLVVGKDAQKGAKDC